MVIRIGITIRRAKGRRGDVRSALRSSADCRSWHEAFLNIHPPGPAHPTGVARNACSMQFSINFLISSEAELSKAVSAEPRPLKILWLFGCWIIELLIMPFLIMRDFYFPSAWWIKQSRYQEMRKNIVLRLDFVD